MILNRMPPYRPQNRPLQEMHQEQEDGLQPIFHRTRRGIGFAPDIRKLAIQKLVQCQKVFYFSDPLRNVKSIEVKRAALLNYNSDQRLTPGDTVYPAIIRMATTNLFREMPPPPSSDFDPEEDERTLELAWPHLHLVYELFLCFIENQGFLVGVGKKLVDSNFVLNILRLFDSEDPREPDYLKTMLHPVYRRITASAPSFEGRSTTSS